MKKLFLIILSSSLICVPNLNNKAQVLSKTKQPVLAIAIHGGAGTILKRKMTPEQEKQYREMLSRAVNKGYAVLEKGGTSMDAVEAAINVMENSPLFNSGIGAVYTYDETHELDASIMDGKTRQAGAVAGVKHIKNPISLARLVLSKSVHVLLSGKGAEDFAQTQNVPLVDNHIFDTAQRLKSLHRVQKKLEQADNSGKNFKSAFEQLDYRYKTGTVGAVALDRFGNLAAGTSTGGMTNKRFGRIGDSPIIGAGTFADNASCAVSATGHGEFFIRFNVAADICARVKYQGKTIQQAGDEVIHGVLEPIGGMGGVIILDNNGNISQPFNTAGMYRATKTSQSKTMVKIFKDE